MSTIKEELDNNSPMGTMKCTHKSTSSDSNKDISLDCQNNLKVALVATPLEGWIKVAKKKGKKRRSGDQPQTA